MMDCKANITVGPAIVSAAQFPDASKFQIRGLKNGNVLQDCPLTYVLPSINHYHIQY